MSFANQQQFLENYWEHFEIITSARRWESLLCRHTGRKVLTRAGWRGDWRLGAGHSVGSTIPQWAVQCSTCFFQEQLFRNLLEKLRNDNNKWWDTADTLEWKYSLVHVEGEVGVKEYNNVVLQHGIWFCQSATTFQKLIGKIEKSLQQLDDESLFSADTLVGKYRLVQI